MAGVEKDAAIVIGNEVWLLHEFDEPHKTIFANEGTVGLEIVATIRKNETGEMATRSDWLLYNQKDDGDHVSAYIWEEGNYSCDCNREQFFEAVHGRDFDGICCTDGRFSVSLANKLTGHVFYDELTEEK